MLIALLALNLDLGRSIQCAFQGSRDDGVQHPDIFLSLGAI